MRSESIGLNLVKLLDIDFKSLIQVEELYHKQEYEIVEIVLSSNLKIPKQIKMIGSIIVQDRIKKVQVLTLIREPFVGQKIRIFKVELSLNWRSYRESNPGRWIQSPQCWIKLEVLPQNLVQGFDNVINWCEIFDKGSKNDSHSLIS